MSAAFARYLPQFTVDRPGDRLAGSEILFSPKAKESTIDVLVEAEERGRREGAATAKAEAEQARGEAEIAFERRMGQERGAGPSHRPMFSPRASRKGWLSSRRGSRPSPHGSSSLFWKPSFAIRLWLS